MHSWQLQLQSIDCLVLACTVKQVCANINSSVCLVARIQQSEVLNLQMRIMALA